MDKPRIVQVGFNAKYLADLKARVGLGRAVQALLASGDIDAIWVFDTKLGQLAGPEVVGPASARFPSEDEITSIKEALRDHQTRSVLSSDALSVIAPINTDGKGIIGAALVRIPTERMWQAVRNQIGIAALIALAVLGAGVALIYLTAKRQVAPIERLTAAATAIEERRFNPKSLESVGARPDEIGRLARVFSGMGQTVLAREEKLDTLVQERTKALAERTEQLETLSTKLSKYLSPQVYASIFQGTQPVGIASNRKKLTIFFSDLVGFTETTETLESEELTAILNRYLNEMAGIALKYGATLDKYVGDAILAFFGDPETRGVAEDAKACVAMALEMQRASPNSMPSGATWVTSAPSGAHGDQHRLLHGGEFRQPGPHGLHHHWGCGESRFAARRRRPSRHDPDHARHLVAGERLGRCEGDAILQGQGHRPADPSL